MKECSVQIKLRCRAFRGSPVQDHHVQVDPDGQVSVYCDRQHKFVYNHDMAIGTRQRARRIAWGK